MKKAQTEDSSDDFILKSDEEYSDDEQFLFGSSDENSFLNKKQKRDPELFSESSENEDILQYFDTAADNDTPQIQNTTTTELSSSKLPKYSIFKHIFRCNNRIKIIKGNKTDLFLLDTRGVIYCVDKAQIKLADLESTQINLNLHLAFKLDRSFVSDFIVTDDKLLCFSSKVGVLKEIQIANIKSNNPLKFEECFVANEVIHNSYDFKLPQTEKNGTLTFFCLVTPTQMIVTNTKCKKLKIFYFKDIKDVKLVKNELYICQDDRIHIIKVKLNKDQPIFSESSLLRPNSQISLNFLMSFNSINGVNFYGTESGLKFKHKICKYGAIRDIVCVKNETSSETEPSKPTIYKNTQDGIIIVSADKLRINHKNIQICMKAWLSCVHISDDDILITDGKYIHLIRSE